MDNYSLSDIASVANDGGFGGNNAWVLIIILFVLIFGANGFGRQGEFGQYATAASQNEILFGQQFQGLDNKIDRIGNGICDSTYALNNSILGAQNALGTAITSEGRGIQTQLSNCCCENLRNTDSIRFDMSNYTAATQAAIHAEGEATRAMLQQNKIEALQSKVSALELQNAVAGVVRYPQSSCYTNGYSPFCNCNCNGNI